MKTFITIESKLTTAERKDLPDKMFGLPKTRQYPLIDEEHVRKAIQFFNYAPKPKRSELAVNINKRIKELKMNVNVGKDNPFYKYMSTEVVKEFYDTSLVLDESGTGFEDLAMMIEEFKDKFSVKLFNMFNRLFDRGSIDAIKDIELELYTIFTDKEFRKKYFYKVIYAKSSQNPFAEINDIVCQGYKTIFNFIEYNTNLSMTNSRMSYDIIEDFTKLIGDAYSSDNEEKLNRMIKDLSEYMADFPVNFYHIFRRLVEVEFNTVEYGSRGLSDLNTDEHIIRKRMHASILKLTNTVRESLEKSSVVIDPYVANDYLDQLTERDFKLASITTNLSVIKKELDSQLYIIKKDNAASFMSTTLLSDIGNSVGWKPNELPGSPDIGENVSKTLQNLNGALRVENVKAYDPSLTAELTDQDIIQLNKLGSLGNIIVGSDNIGHPVYYVVQDCDLFLITKNTSRLLQQNCGMSVFDLIPLTDDNRIAITANLVSSRKDHIRTGVQLKRIFVKPSTAPTDMSVLTEGFYIDQDGNMKFQFSPKKTFMDEYAENHKVLVENHKSGNTEGMKRNIAFMFALITEIERDLHKGKFTPDQREKAVKARAFATNDFKTYLKHILKAEPKFDFTEYYTNSDYGKLIVNVRKEEIQGIKQLVRTLLL